MSQLKATVLCFSILSFIIAGCATEQPRIPAEEIRERANRAFDELKVEEVRDSASPLETRREDRRPFPEPEPRGPVQIKITTGERPDWVDGDSARYPSSRYLIGVGYASVRQLAEDNARSEIAKIFSSKIDSQTRIYQEYLQTTSRAGSAQTESFEIEQISRVSTQRVLSGVRISKVYQETEPDPIFYALAVLDRDQTAAILRHKIQDLDQGIERLLTRAAEEEDILIKIKYLKKSVRKYLLRETHDAELRIVSRFGGGVPSAIRFTEIKNRLDTTLLRDFSIGLSITGSRAEEIREALVQGLNQQGFSVCEDPMRANVLVRGTVEIKPLDRGTSEWKYVQWRAHFDLVDQRGGAVFGSLNETGRDAHLSLLQAEDRAVRRIQKTLATDIAKEMKNYIFSP